MATSRTASAAPRMPSFATPTTLDLRALQLLVSNIREGMRALDARIELVAHNGGAASVSPRSTAGTSSDLRQQLVELRTRVDELSAAVASFGTGAPTTLPATVYLLDMGDGEDGEDGCPGAPGPRGVPGPAIVIPGEDGEDGEDGVPGMPPAVP